MNPSIFPRILRSLAIVTILALAAVGLEQTVAALSRAGGSGPTTQAQVVQPQAPSATATAAPPQAQVQVATQPTAAATAAPPPPQVQVATQPTAAATYAAPPPPPAAAQVEVGGIITAVNPAAGTITVNDDEGFTSVVSVSGAGNYAVGQDVDVVGTPTGPGGSVATVRAQYATVEAPEAAEPPEGAEQPDYDAPEAPEQPYGD
jgi:hypothetical protein